MSFTVVLATRNNAPLLASTLQSLCQVQVPCPQWRMVIVNNGSTDATDSVIDSFANKLPLIKVFEPRAGKTRALNRAIPLLEGDLAIFTDDDVLYEPDWLQRYWDAAQSCKEYAVFGGTIIPVWPNGTANPDGLDEERLGVLYAITPPGLVDGPVNPGLVWGSNMAVRTEVFRAGHRFDESIGPDDTDDFPMGDETSFNRHLQRCGYRVWHIAKARVHHMIRPFQLERNWALRRARRFGRAQFLRETEDGGPADMPSLFGYPRWVLRRMVELKLGSFLPLSRARKLKMAWEYYRLQGYALQGIAYRKRQQAQRTGTTASIAESSNHEVGNQIPSTKS
jgi:L-malate glycosyltransferase